MNITDQQKETLAAEATKIFIQDPERKNLPKMLEISNIENGENIFKGQAELIMEVLNNTITDGGVAPATCLLTIFIRAR